MNEIEQQDHLSFESNEHVEISESNLLSHEELTQFHDDYIDSGQATNNSTGKPKMKKRMMEKNFLGRTESVIVEENSS